MKKSVAIAKNMGSQDIPPACPENGGQDVRVPGEAGSFANTRSSGRFLIWSYHRGSIQYDIICVLILAFIFLIPRGCFVRGKNEPSDNSGRQTIEEAKSAVGGQ